ncbi:cyclophilin-like family protein [Vulcanisaeta distributa]|uniref:cyclophilin-like family protein n=1 Tax=Vulcanisaeta distributa TaxID=164451 RepID=UPI001FB4B065|nr:cyclophilin-like family protein [Vulcanisaeta distributa]
MHSIMESELILEVKDLGNIVVRLEPALSPPLTYARLGKSLPIRSNAIKYSQVILIPLDLGLVSEGKRTSLKPYEVGYWVKKRSLVIALGNVDLGEQVNVLGYVVNGAELLSKLNGGYSIKLSIR